ncbi:hypothetical protein OG2516_14091 [Oceanicola granulosus HTCC2516]|uniref:Hedgehog/Intein (Hint) domain-containing protein n=1 Tax=Oceanicola granulosus (strain ATCC BAA-861 / DSM 15982 / KCTC 12143 / HTCC2516) TaxID=314256 RepID=Q2CAT6_OCEGH|nr:Hint domain-containing protein [Oceanicola granulosus]EAR49795.1 hypothetical protein OG2516_14091 [Oceanicola granulosus HTCC2516]
MRAGFRGTFVISWTQTEVDGLWSAPVTALRKGAMWRWRGDLVRVDGPNGVLPLGPALGAADIRQRAAASLRRHGRAAAPSPPPLPDDDAPDAFSGSDDEAFTVTDGTRLWRVRVIQRPRGRSPLCLFEGAPPPAEAELWVVRRTLRTAPRDPEAPRANVICFTPGTLIRTERGALPVERIAEGTRVQTKDNGCRPVLWTGRRRISGARLRAMPELAPVRFRPGAVASDVPDGELLVSPGHRVLVGGRRAEAMFATPEVLVAAADLVDGRGIDRVRGLAGLIYIHLALEQHEILFANGVATESFHPAAMPPGRLDAADAARLEALVPGVSRDPTRYGPFARRLLSAPEAAILAGMAA